MSGWFGCIFLITVEDTSTTHAPNQVRRLQSEALRLPAIPLLSSLVLAADCIADSVCKPVGGAKKPQKGLTSVVSWYTIGGFSGP